MNAKEVKWRQSNNIIRNLNRDTINYVRFARRRIVVASSSSVLIWRTLESETWVLNMERVGCCRPWHPVKVNEWLYTQHLVVGTGAATRGDEGRLAERFLSLQQFIERATIFEGSTSGFCLEFYNNLPAYPFFYMIIHTTLHMSGVVVLFSIHLHPGKLNHTLRKVQ